MSTIEITLSAANMGPKSTEHDFNAWAAYVAANIDDALDIDATVDQFAFTGRGAESEDRIEGAEDDEEREAVEANSLRHVSPVGRGPGFCTT